MASPSFTCSWVSSANGHSDFPLQNLPFGIFSYGESEKRAGVAIGDYILDLRSLASTGLVEGNALVAIESTYCGQLNDFFSLAGKFRTELREQVTVLLLEGCPFEETVKMCLLEAKLCEMHLPVKVGNYTDFYVGIEHAKNVGKLFRPDNPLLPNYKHVPIGYHGRASTVRPSGHQVRRPNGQMLAQGMNTPEFGPSQRMDFELELGIWIGSGNPIEQPIPIDQAQGCIAGYCLLNDWSARDIQAWEYQPLGPFLSKSFVTSVSAWVVTPEALQPYQRAQAPRPEGDPQPLPYLWGANDQASGAFDIQLEVWIVTEKMRTLGLPQYRISTSNTLSMYWTVAQMVTHHTVNGCQLESGDLLGSGTLSGSQPGQFGSLLELTDGGKNPISLPSGETRRFLEDGDEIILKARCIREGFAPIGFGSCRGKVVASHQVKHL